MTITGIHFLRAKLAKYRDEAAAEPALYNSLVRSLYSTPKSILAATFIAIAIACVSFNIEGDIRYLVFAGSYGVIGACRALSLAIFHRQKDLIAVQNLLVWELFALLGAVAFAFQTGLVGAYSVICHPGSHVELLTSCCVMGYIAGISSRNASRPTITVTQISAICIPFLYGLIFRADVTHFALALFILCLFGSTIVMAKSMHQNIILRHRAHSSLEKAALHDSLTGLKSRTAFIQFATDVLAKATGPMALLTIDLDRFKNINDRLGHPAGDAVLIEAGRRVVAAIKIPNVVARVGGDEFLVALPDVGCESARRVAEAICEALSEQYRCGDTAFSCGASVGLAISPGDGQTYDELMRASDLALYAAKTSGRGRVEAYAPGLGAAFDARVDLEHNLRLALDRSEFWIAYQPIVDAATGKVVCCEALLRWKHPVRGNISPAEFIPIAEATGLIGSIGEWTLRTACQEASSWPSHVKVAVNLSPLQLLSGLQIVDVVRRALKDASLTADRLELEVTESVLIEDTYASCIIIDALRTEGVGISLDDFGAGFSSLGYLNDFRFSKLKIDRKLCQDVTGSPRTQSIVRCIVGLAGELGIDVVAEGIESLGQLEAMGALGIRNIQGFIYCRPISASHVRDFASSTAYPRVTSEIEASRVEVSQSAA